MTASEMTRASFVRRLAAGTAMAVVPMPFLKSLEEIDRRQPPSLAPARGGELVEWWAEWSAETPVQVDLLDESKVVLARHIVPSRSGVYVQYRPERMPRVQRVGLAIKIDGEWRGLDLEPYRGDPHHLTAEGHGLFAGALLA